MSLIDELYEELSGRLHGQQIADVRIGLGYTAVCLESGACGLAYTFRARAGEGCSVLALAGTLAGRPAAELAAWIASDDAIRAALGLATCNALAWPPQDANASDVRGHLDIRPPDTVGMVGYFGPLVNMLRDQVQQLFVFECQERQECPTLPDSAAPSLLPQCDVVILSATTLLNHTLERLLDCSRGARELVVLGPSSPLVPAPFAKRGVTLLSGVVVEKPDKLLRIVSEGGGTRQFGDAVRKLSIRCREAPRPEPSCGTSDRRLGI